MISTSIKFHSVVFGAVLAVSASYAVASAFPVNPLPPVPTGMKAMTSAFPQYPLPPVPTGIKTVASAFPQYPLPPTPTGSKALSA